MSESGLSRRDFLKVGAAAVASALPFTARADTLPNVNVTQALDSFALTDQYGKEWKAADAVAGKPYLMVFGYEGCPLCEGKISKNLAALQQALLKDGAFVPIVVASIHPDDDRERTDQYTQTYYDLGVKQFADEKDGVQKEPQAAYDAAKDRPAKDRLLHIVCTQSNEKAAELHKAVGRPRPTEEKAHTQLAIVVDANGKYTAHAFAGFEPADEKRTAAFIKEIRQSLKPAEIAR